MMGRRLLEVRDLRTHFDTNQGLVRSVDGVSFDIDKGGCLGVVGESGSGKSVTALSIMRLIQKPPGRFANGEILFEGRDLLKASDREMRRIRGNEISMIFQEPMTSLNPVFTIGNQITETIVLHQRLSRAQARARAVEMLDLVGIADAHRRIDQYPHHLSGGMRQRVMIAMALSCNPKLLIADEPTTALDVTIQAQILDLMRNLRTEVEAAIMLITHDLGVIAEVVDEVVVMYAGKVVERAAVTGLFASPKHPYTIGLLDSIPKIDETRRRLKTIEGTVPNPAAFPPGCRFNPRCPLARDICRTQEPPLMPVTADHQSACWKHTDFQLVAPIHAESTDAA
jgi:peptide/nickel transport system ATP-binding protein/oligopeptide transport system ATP-binding protein